MNLPSLFFHKKNNFFPVASLFHSERPVRRKRFKRETVRRKDPAGEKIMRKISCFMKNPDKEVCML